MQQCSEKIAGIHFPARKETTAMNKELTPKANGGS
jgi:hypothetical protein